MKRGGLAAPLIKSIIFVVVTVLITAVLGISIAYTGVSATVGYRAVFSDVTGLTVGDDVDIAGVRVGEVTSISVYDRNRALVGFSVQPGRPLPASVTASIMYLNLVGQRYLELGQGTGPANGTLPPGGTIPLSRTTPALNLTVLFNGFQPLFQALSPGDVNQLTSDIIQVFQGESPNITALVATVGSLTTALASKDQVIDEVIGNLNSVLRTITSRGNALASLVTSLQQLVSGLAADRQSVGTAISAIASLTSATAGLLQVGRAPLQAGITQLQRLASNLAANSPDGQYVPAGSAGQDGGHREDGLVRLLAELLPLRRHGDRRAQLPGRPATAGRPGHGGEVRVVRRLSITPVRERNPIAVAVAGLAIVAVIVLLTYFSGSLPLIGGGTGYTAYFAEAAGLQAGNEVRDRGRHGGPGHRREPGRRQGGGDVPGERSVGRQPDHRRHRDQDPAGRQVPGARPGGPRAAGSRPGRSRYRAPARPTT